MEHHFEIDLEWTGNLGHGTSNYTSYSRDHLIQGTNKVPLLGSSDPAFRGDKSKYNPEELFIASIASCHMLWYLHLCADHGIIVLSYYDHPTGLLLTPKEEAGRFTEVVLNPRVTIQDIESKLNLALDLHQNAHKKCFIANSCSFSILCNPEIIIESS